MSALNLDLEYFGHRKTRRLVSRLGDGAEVIPLKLWSYTGKYHAEDGLLSGYQDDELAMLCGVSGNATSIFSALVDVGFLNKTATGYEVHQWNDHQGHIAAFKKRGKEAAIARWSKLKPDGSNATSNAPTDGANGALPTDETKGERPPAPDLDGFKKPSFEEVAAYCQERGNKIKPADFLSYYEMRGWLVSGRPLQNWKAAVVRWENREGRK